jgi:very-short-patch-repair endonuclease
MTKEQKFYKALQDVFIGAKIEGTGGFVNLMRIKSNYYRKIEELLKKDIDTALEKYPAFRDELFDKLYSFFSRYFTESGSIYFNSTPFHNNIYEKVYTDEKDVILFWKTQMLYYVKTDRIFRSIPVEFDNHKFYFDATTIENKKANEKRSLIFELKEIKEDKTIVFNVYYSEQGRVTKTEDILKELKKKEIKLDEETLERAFRIFEKQSEVDFFINKNAKAFLQEQFKLWSYQYFWEGAKEWSADRVNQLQILKDIAFKIIDFISQFEDELVKIWNKPKFVKNANYVITLDRIFANSPLQKRYQSEDFDNSPLQKGWQSEGLTGYSKLPYNPKLKERARELRKAGNLSEVLLWNELKQKKMLGFDFTRQQIIGNYIVDFHCPKLNLVIEIDGESHNYKVEYDEERDKFLQSLGLTVLHFNDLDIKHRLSEVLESIKNWIEGNTPSSTDDTPLTKGNLLGEDDNPLTKGNLLRIDDNPLGNGNLLERIFSHSNIDKQIKEWQELGIVDENFKIEDVFENDLTGKHLSKKYEHLPIDTKYFKDLELEILSLFDDLDNSLDGWLIKSENYQALNTILPKFKEKVQTIYIDPPFNLDSSDQFLYRTNYKDANWATLLENRLRIAREWLNEKGSIFVRCDYNGNWIVRCLMDEIFGKENFKNELIISRISKQDPKVQKFNTATDSLFYYSKTDAFQFNLLFKQLAKAKTERWHAMDSQGQGQPLYIFDYLFDPPKGRHWTYGQENIKQMEKERRIRLKCRKCGYIHISGSWKECPSCKNKEDVKVEYLLAPTEIKQIDSNWTDVSGYTSNWDFQTENSEILLKRAIEAASNEGDLVMDFFLGSGTTTAVAHKLGRKWIGVEMGEHFYTVVLPRMKKVLAYDKSGISKELKTPRQTSSDTPLQEGIYQGGGFFKYYELEQYEEALANCKYEDGDLFNSPLIKGWHSEGMTGYLPGRSPYQEYVFLKDEKMLKALEIDYENNKVKVDLTKLYPNIDIAETLSNLTGKWIKKITPRQTSSDTPLKEGNNTPLAPLQERNYEVEFEDGTKVNTKDLDYKLIKPLIWWE